MTDIRMESKKELYRFIAWFNRFYGSQPTIIGGWAVYYYNSYFMSKDVDVVFHSKRAGYDGQLLEYFAHNGYKEMKKDHFGFETTFRKEVGGDYIDIDACNVNDANKFHSNQNLEIPYSLVGKNSVEVSEIRYGIKADYYVPSIELLLLYKIKAYRDRDFESTRTAIQNIRAHLVSKRDKDGSDILALLDSKNARKEADFEKMGAFVSKFALTGEVSAALQAIKLNASSRDNYKKLDKNGINRLLDSATQKIAGNYR